MAVVYMAEDVQGVEYWRNRRMCGPILRHLAQTDAWLGLNDLCGALNKRLAPVQWSLGDLMDAGLIQDTWMLVKGVLSRKYRLTEKGRTIARLLDT